MLYGCVHAHKSFSSEGQSKTCDNQSEVKNHFVCFTQVGDLLVEFDGVLGTRLPLLRKHVDKIDKMEDEMIKSLWFVCKKYEHILSQTK